MMPTLSIFKFLPAGILIASFFLVPLTSSPAQDVEKSKEKGKVKAPESRYGFELKVRKAGEDKFNDKTQKYGLEVFVDPNSNKVIYISETGSCAVLGVPPSLPKGKARDPQWQSAMELRVRKAGENDFSKDTKKYGVEVYRDEDAGNLIYISETGSIAVVPGNSGNSGKSEDPVWKYAMNLKARKAGEKDFTGSTKSYGIEVFRDEINKTLIYMTDSGAIGVVAANVSGSEKSKTPDWKGAMELRVRKGGEPDFNEKTQKTGAEVFLDGNINRLIYLSDTGFVSIPSTLQITGKGGPDWKYGLDLKVRKAGENDFSKARSFGVEVFLDEPTGGLIYITETGALGAISK